MALKTRKRPTLTNRLLQPVLTRLERHESLLEEIRQSLQIQFRRTAEVQAQLDKLIRQTDKDRASVKRGFESKRLTK